VAEDRPRVRLDLQQARHVDRLPDLDARRGLFKADEVGEPVRHGVAEAPPPAWFVRLLDHVEERLALRRVLDAVHRQQVGDVAFLEPDPAQLEPADLGLRPADVVAGLLAGDARLLTEPAQLRAQDHPPRRRADVLFATGRVHRVHSRTFRAHVTRGF
jgi:hypothetical protein